MQQVQQTISNSVVIKLPQVIETSNFFSCHSFYKNTGIIVISQEAVNAQANFTYDVQKFMQFVPHGTYVVKRVQKGITLILRKKSPS